MLCPSALARSRNRSDSITPSASRPTRRCGAPPRIVTAKHGTSATTITETFSYTITDKDGDPVTRTVTFGVSDSGITNPAATSASVDEDNIATVTGNAGGPGDLAAQVTTGTISYTKGADAITSVTLSAAATGFTKLDGVTAVNTYFDAGTRTLIGYGGADQNDVVFKIALGALGQANTGYTVTLLQAVKHPTGDNPATPGVNESTEDDLTVNVTATITDADNSTNTASFTVTLDDDSPVVVHKANF